jgi:hypothetical protein
MLAQVPWLRTLQNSPTIFAEYYLQFVDAGPFFFVLPFQISCAFQAFLGTLRKNLKSEVDFLFNALKVSNV